MKTIAFVGTVLLFLIAEMAASKAGDYHFVNVADSTMSDALGPFTSFSAPSLDHGVAAFKVGYAGSFSIATIYTGNIGPLTPIQSTGGAVTSFGSAPAIDDGNVVFDALLSDGTSALHRGSGGPVSVVAQSGDPGPEGPLTQFLMPDIDGPTVAFFAREDGQPGILAKQAGTSRPSPNRATPRRQERSLTWPAPPFRARTWPSWVSTTLTEAACSLVMGDH